MCCRGVFRGHALARTAGGGQAGHCRTARPFSRIQVARRAWPQPWSCLPCGGTILACRLTPGRSPQMPQPHATRCVLFAQPSAQRADGVGVGGWDQKCAVGIVGIGLSSVCVRWGSVLSSLPPGHPFCTGPVNGYAKGVSIWGGLVEKGRTSYRK